jgi:hypothetical protein
MRYSVAALAFAAGAQAMAYNYSSPAVYTTEVVTAYTTYCPEATEITHGGVTYHVSEATTLTITNCPCTVTKPVSSAVVTSCSTCTETPVVYTSVETSAPAPVTSSLSGYASSAPAPYPVANSTIAYVPTGATGTGSTTAYPSFTGAANKAFAASGAGLAAVFGLAAYVL